MDDKESVARMALAEALRNRADEIENATAEIPVNESKFMKCWGFVASSPFQAAIALESLGIVISKLVHHDYSDLGFYTGICILCAINTYVNYED